MASTAISTEFNESKVDAIFAAVDQCQLPGAAVAIASGGVPVYRKGFGLANMELPTLLTPAMRMRIGSTTKHFVALAYLLLCEEGLAGIDDEIGRYVPNLHPTTATAKIRQLLGHTSGVRDVLALSMMMNGINRPVSDQQMLALYATIDDLNFEPGTGWDYNNGAYMLVSAAIESITGARLEDVLQHRIFEPAGMHDTMLRRWDHDFVSNCATLHFRDTSGEWSRTYMGTELSGAGGMLSTMDDMLRWMKFLDAPAVGSAETWHLMRAPQHLANGTSTRYGFGLISEPYRGVETIHHAGGLLGGNSQMIKVPAAGLDITIAVNRADVNAAALAYQVIDACVEGLDPIPETADYEKRTGVFVSASNGRVASLAEMNGMQLMSVDGASPLPMSPDATGVLQLPAVVGFLQQSARIGKDSIVLAEFGNENVLAEIETDSDATLGDHVGVYRSDTLDTTFTITGDSAGNVILSQGRHGFAKYSMEPITHHLWRIQGVVAFMISGIITFDADGGGFTLDASRTPHLRFTKVQ